MMRIGVVVEQLRQRVPGGIGTYAAGLMKGLRSLDDPSVEVVAIASRGPRPDPLSMLADELVTTSLPHRLQMRRWDRGSRSPKGDFDVVHLTSFAGPVTLNRSWSTTVMIHDLAWRARPELTTTRGAKWHEAALVRVLRSGARLITPSGIVAGELLAEGVDPDRLSVIGEGSDHLPAPDEEGVAALLKNLGVEGDFLLTVSTLEPRKNLTMLLAAHERAGERVPPLVVVGPQGWGPSLKPSPRVHLVGRQSDEVLSGLYEQCRAFAYVPILEGFGLPPMEAMASGAPVVVTSTTPSTMSAPGTWRVDPRDVEGIADAIEEACEESDLRREAIEAGRRFASTHRWVDVAAAHLELWKSL